MFETILGWLILVFILVLFIAPFVSLVWFIYCFFKFKFEKNLTKKAERKRLFKISTIITFTLIPVSCITLFILFGLAVQHM